MSRSPLQAIPDADAQTYVEGFIAMRQMLRQGAGWSGGERNCLFLNTEGRRFANISATSGADFADDARALASADWDFDGDLDWWVTNRTGPKLRFLRNDVPREAQFVSVLLEGQSCNREAIGARLELWRSDGARLVRSVRAGDGFLGQSSRWVHFGLGSAEIERLVVHWPGGEREEIGGLRAGAFQRVVQGSGAAAEWKPPLREQALQPSPLAVPKGTDRARVVFANPVPAPELVYEDFQGTSHSTAERTGKPLLINLWASWCSPCVGELRDFARHAESLSQSGLQVLPLSVDGLAGPHSGDRATAKALLDSLHFPFAAGSADAASLDMIELLHGAMIYPLGPFPVPTSILVDREGWAVAVYEGPVEMATLLEDVARLGTPAATRRDAAVPFPGTWSQAEAPFDYLHGMGLDYLDLGYPQFAETHYRKLLQRDPDNAQWQHHRGLALAALGRHEEALQCHQRALELAPETSSVHAELGATLVQLGRAEEAAPHLEQALRLEPGRADAVGNLGMVLAARGRTREAVAHWRQALSVLPDWVPGMNALAWAIATSGDASLGAPGEAVQLAERACQLTGSREPPYLDTLAAAYARSGNFPAAVATARQALARANETGQAALAKEIQVHLRNYESGKPYVGTTAQTF